MHVVHLGGLLRNSGFPLEYKCFAPTAKVHDVQIRSQADTLTAQAARRLAKVRDAQIRSQADTRTAIAAYGAKVTFLDESYFP